MGDKGDNRGPATPAAGDDLDLTPAERGAIRHEFMVRFGQAPSLRAGFLVKRRATGPERGAPRPSGAVRSMVERGILSLEDDGQHWLRARFTAKGYEALRRLARDRRLLPPDEYGHLLDELSGAAGRGADDDRAA